MILVHFPLTNINVTVGVYHAAITILQRLFPKSFVSVAFRVNQNARTTVLVFNIIPITFIRIPIVKLVERLIIEIKHDILVVNIVVNAPVKRLNILMNLIYLIMVVFCFVYV